MSPPSQQGTLPVLSSGDRVVRADITAECGPWLRPHFPTNVGSPFPWPSSHQAPPCLAHSLATHACPMPHLLCFMCEFLSASVTAVFLRPRAHPGCPWDLGALSPSYTWSFIYIWKKTAFTCLPAGVTKPDDVTL